MLNLTYTFKHIYTSKGEKERIYLIPCPSCKKERWIQIHQRSNSCRSCGGVKANSKRYVKSPCIYKKCLNLVTQFNKYCRTHKRLVINRYKVEARWAVHNAKLQHKPCVYCGIKKAEAHHPDHNNKLDVVWLCKPHHLKEHGGRFN